MSTNGSKGEAKAWPDGMRQKWSKCPGCGNKASLFDVVTEGEGAVKPPGTTKLFTLIMPYETLLQAKELIAMLDICESCGTMYCRGIIKRPAQVGTAPIGRN